MTYTLRETTTLLVWAACFIIVAHALEWNGYLLMCVQSTDGAKDLLLQSHQWSLIEGKVITGLYNRQDLALARSHVADGLFSNGCMHPSCMSRVGTAPCCNGDRSAIAGYDVLQ